MHAPFYKTCNTHTYCRGWVPASDAVRHKRSCRYVLCGARQPIYLPPLLAILHGPLGLALLAVYRACIKHTKLNAKTEVALPAQADKCTLPTMMVPSVVCGPWADAEQTPFEGAASRCS